MQYYLFPKSYTPSDEILKETFKHVRIVGERQDQVKALQVTDVRDEFVNKIDILLVEDDEVDVYNLILMLSDYTYCQLPTEWNLLWVRERKHLTSSHPRSRTCRFL